MQEEELPNYHRRGGVRIGPVQIIVILLGAALVYAGILLGIQALGSRLEGRTAVETTGSLDGRFDTTGLAAQRGGGYRASELTNLLLIGVDDAGSALGGTADEADFLLLLTMDRKNKAVSALQLDCDTVADIRAYDDGGNYAGVRQARLRQAYGSGTSAAEGCKNTVWAVSGLLGNIPIDGYIALDLSCIAALTEALGGVDITLEEDYSQIDPALTAGAALTLRGQQAEHLVRDRESGDDGTNAARMRRQRAFFRALRAQLKLLDMRTLSALYDAVKDHVVTNVDRSWLVNRAYECVGYAWLEIGTPAGSYRTGADGAAEFYVDADALAHMLAANYYYN